MVEDAKLLALLAGVTTTLIHLFVVCLLLRITRQRFLLIVMMVAFFIAMLITWLFFGGLISVWHYLAFAIAGFVLVLFLYGAVAKSLSLTMLTQFPDKPDGKMSHAELDSEITLPAFASRVDLLVEKGWVLKKNDIYKISELGRQKAALITSIRRWFHVENSGLYGD